MFTVAKGRKLKISALFPTILFCALAVAATTVRGQSLTGTPGVAVKTAVIDFSELAGEQVQARESVTKPRPIFRRTPGPEFWEKRGMQAEAAPQTRQSVSSRSLKVDAVPNSPSPATNFLAAPDTGFIPPDTMGAVGPNHLMVTLNGTVRIQNRNGSVISSITLDQFWASLGPFSSTFPTFDPKIFYDSFADRWIFNTPADGELAASSVLIGVSQTSDPTRKWNLYRFTADSTGTAWADYPSVGFNSKWVVVSYNMFLVSGTGYQGAKTWVFDKADLYAGGTGRFNTFTDSSGFTQSPVVSFDKTEPTMYVVEDFTDRTLRISTITGPVGQERFNIGTATAISPDAWSFNGNEIAPQKGTTKLIENNDARIINSVFRDGTIWTAQTVFLPAGGSPTRSAVQWWQINPNGNIIQRGRIDDPSGQKFYAFPSIAVNRAGDALVGYSRFAADQYAGANYSFRFSSDPPNTLQSDLEFKAGEGPYDKSFGVDNRWGDYSATMPDPLNDMDLWTIQEYAAAPVGNISQWSTWWAMVRLSEPPDNILEVVVDPPTQSSLVAGAGTNIVVKVSDVFPVTNATVRAAIPGLPDLQFSNNGVPPDAAPNDNFYTATLVPPATQGTLTMALTVTAPGKQDFATNIIYNIFPVPPNDMFTNAIKIPSQGAFGPNTINTENNFATTEAGEPFHAGVTTRQASLWWNWSSTVDTPVLIDTSGSGIDTVVAVYTGSRVDQLTEVASIDDVGTRAQGYLTFDAKAGTTYRIVVAGKDLSQQGPIRLRVEPNGVPDIVPPRISVDYPPSGLVVETDTVGMRGTSIDPPPNASGIRVIRVNNLTSTEGASAVANGTTNWSYTMSLNFGTNILEAFAVDFAGNRSDAKLLTIYYKPVLVPNDLFGNAIALTSNSGTVTATNSAATKEFNEPAHAGNEGGKSVWWKFTPPADGVLLLTTEGSTAPGSGLPLDTLLGLYTGNFVNALTEVASNDDASPGSGFSEITASVHGGQTYHIAVDGYAGASGIIKLSYTFESGTVFEVRASVEGGGGTVTPSFGIFPNNSTVTFTANPAPNFELQDFETPEGVVLSTKNPLTLNITGPTKIVVRFAPKRFSDGFETGDFSKLPWQSSGWVVENSVVANGQFAAASTTHDRNGTNALILQVELLPGLGTFQYRISTETNYDQLQFYVNDQLRDEWSGEIPWTLYTFDVSGGPTKLEWRYVKDNAINQGADTVYIDDVDLPIGAPVGPRLAISTNREVQFAATPGQSYAIQVSSDLTNWTTIATRVADTNGQVTFTEPLQPGQNARFYRVQAQ
jgi:hypothetical protein